VFAKRFVAVNRRPAADNQDHSLDSAVRAEALCSVQKASAAGTK